MKRWSLTTPAVALSIGIAAACGYSDNSGKSGGPGAGAPAPGTPGGPTAGKDGGVATAPPAPGGPGGGTPTPPTPVPPPPPTSATYVRASMTPVFQLLPRTEYGRVKIAVQGVVTQFQDSDLETTAVTTSAAAKEAEVGQLIGQDSGGGTAVTVIKDASDQQRANLIPFRGKPSDVKLVNINGLTKLYVPLGGDVQTVGDEVAVVSVGNNALTTQTRIQVGVRPQRIAIHPAGLVFVCNQYSNYISIIDPRTDQILTKGNAPVEIKTEQFCADLAFVPAPDNNPDHQFLYVANRWRHSVLKYEAFVVRDSSNRPIDVIQSATPNPTPANKPIAEILGVGNNPWRLSLSDQQNGLYVANNKGGEVARVDVTTDTVSSRIGINAPSADVININNLLFVPTTMPARGLVSQDLPVPAQLQAAPVVVTGLDGQQHTANPGAIFDNTRSYNFEDTRNGLQQLDFLLGANQTNSFYYTDDISSEPNFVATQKVLTGAEPVAIARNAAGTLIYLAMSGSDVIQELAVNVANQPNAVSKTGRNFATQHRPFALTLDEKNNRLFVADWGSELVEQIDLVAGKSVAQADTGYAQPTYPATNVESGEFNFYSAAWSNNARKACATCHFDELDTDGVGFSQGAVAPTTLAEVKPNHNLGTTDGYFWNGSFADGNYTSLAFAFQTRTNCNIVEFGFVEGAGSDPNTRVGDPNNLFTNGQDVQCRPIDGTPGSAANAAQINAVDKAEQAIAHAQIQKITGFQFENLARVIDAYSVSGVHLPPNPLHQQYLASNAAGATPSLDSQTMADIAQGKSLFTSVGCATCHDPTNTRHPFSDGLNHGSGAGWLAQFINTYQNDPRVTSTIGTFPQTMLDALSSSVNDHEVNAWTRADYFIFACFSLQNCLEFDDPLPVRGEADETRRLNLLITVNLQDPDRLFIPGDVVGSATINTPSLRGVWSEANLLHHGLAHTIREAILGPGHAALEAGETGFAIDQFGNYDVHGATQKLSKADVQALVRYVENIE